MLDFRQPFRPDTYFGIDSLNKLPQLVSGERVLLVYGAGSVKTTGVYDRIIDLLPTKPLEYGGIGSNPKLSQIREAINLAKEQQVDQIIAVGGGSVLDAAKAISLGACSDFDIWDIYTQGKPVTAAVDLLTIVTNVATGSEANDVSVIVNDQIDLKRSIKNPLIYPKIAILDPVLTTTVSEYTTRYGIVDAFSHLLEQYFNNTNNPVIDGQLASLMVNIIELGPKLLADLTNLELRQNHMLIAYLGYNCDFRNQVGGDWACHGLDYGLASVFDSTHGAGLAILTPNWMEYISDIKPAKVAAFGRAVFNLTGDDDSAVAKQATAKLRTWLAELNAASKYSDIDIDVTDQKLVEMIDKCKVSYPLGNYCPLEEEAIKAIYLMGK